MSFTEDGVKINRKRGALISLALFGVAELVFSILFTAFLASEMIFPEQARAATGVPSLISYQGRLTDQNGNPKTGTHYFCYSIYDAQSGGTQLWPAGTPTATSTLVSNGVFAAPLGEMDSLASYDFSANDTEYLNVEVSASNGTCGAGPFENLNPRQRLSAVPYARVAYSLYGGDVRIGTGGGTSGKYLYLDVKNTSDTIGGSCSVNGAMWYNSNAVNATALVCNNGAIRLVGATSTIESIQINAATPITSGRVVFTAGSGVSLGTAGQTVSIHAQAPALAASNSTYTSGTVVLTGGNNVTVSYNGQTVSIAAASDKYNSVQFTNSTANTSMNILWAGNSNGSGNITMGLTGSTVTASAAAGGGVAIAASNIATTFATGTVVFSGGNLISISTGAGPAIIVSNLLSSATTVSAVGTANAIGAMASRFALEGHVHAGVPVAGVSGGNTQNTSGTYYGSLMFAGGNNITLSAVTGAGGQTITVFAGYNAAQFTNSTANTTMNILWAGNSNGSGNITMGLTGSTVTASAPSGGGGAAISAAGSSVNAGTVVFSNSNNVSFGMNGSTITATVTIAGASPPIVQYFENMNLGSEVSPLGTNAFTGSIKQLAVFPLNRAGAIFPGNMTANTANLYLSISGLAATMSVAHTSTFWLGLYTLNASTLSLLNSVSTSWGSNAANANLSTVFAGRRWLTFHSSQWSAQPVLTQGHYWFATLVNTAGILNQTGGIFGQNIYASNSGHSGTIGVATANNVSMGLMPFYGIHSLSTFIALPVSIASNDLNKQVAGGVFVPMVVFNNLINSY
jgi:hypothetical protein